MMNKKLIVLFVAIASVSAISAGWYDDNGNYHHGIRPGYVAGDVVEGTGYAARRTVEGAGYAAERTVEGTADVAGGIVGGVLGGKGVRERVRDRRERRYERRGNYRD